MAGFGKNPRHGKRLSSSSSSSHFSMVTMVVFIAFCLLGVWMLTSSSIIPSQATTTHHSRASVSSSNPPPSRLFLREPPPALDDTQSDLPEDAIKGGGEDDDADKPGSKLSVPLPEARDQQDSGTNSEEEIRLKSDEGSGESVENQQQQEEGEDPHRGEEETQQEQMVGNEERQQEEGGNAADRQPSVRRADGGNDDNQQVSLPAEEETQLQSEQQQSDGQSHEEQLNSLEGQHEMQTDRQENQQETHQQAKMETDGEENQHETQKQQQMGPDGDENQQEAQQQQLGADGEGNQQETHQQQQMGADGEDNQQETQQQQMETDGEENQQETQQQQQQMRIDREENQQETQQRQQMVTDGEDDQQETQRQQMVTDGEDDQQETQQQQQQQMWNNGVENQQGTQHQEQQQQGVESERGRIQQQRQTEIDENHDRIQQRIEGNTWSQPQHEEQTDEAGNETQMQPEQQFDTEGSSEDPHHHQQTSRQHTDDGSHTGTSEEGQQQGEEKFTDPNASDSLPDGSQLEMTNESDGKNRPWATQADQSKNEKERRKGEELQSNGEGGSGSNIGNLNGYEWELCNVTAGSDYIPCLDNEKAIRQLHGFKHYEHRERHCPEDSPTCLVPLPNGYRWSIEWPKSRDMIWYNNVPHTKLAEVKGHQNWMKVAGQYLAFPGGGTQFIHGALHYIDFIQQSIRDIAWGKHTRVILDVGCGVASFGGYLFERDVLTMSFAPKDEHEAQVQFALERGIPAISAVMGSQRLPFPSRVFDLVHCARCRVPWHADGGTLLLELNRVLRPGGYFVWSATPVYQKQKEDMEIWKAMKALTVSMCWDLFTIKKNKLNSVAAAFFRKPISNECYDNRKHHSPPMCKEDDDSNAAWYISLKPCMHRVPVDAAERGSQWPEKWPRRVQVPPYWLNSSQIGVYGKPVPDDFTSDYEHWKRVVAKSYLNGFGVNWSKVRNVMDMRAVYGGFAAALKDLKVWVMNVVNIDSPDTLPIIYERGLFGIYHDWCESFSTYPRTYDLLHADHLFSRLKKRCKIVPVMAEVDRIVRPGGKLIVRDESGTVSEVENLLKSLHWEVRLTFSKDQEGILCAEKSDWRPQKFSDSS